MRLNLRELIRVPGSAQPFSYTLDLSGLDFYGERPLPHPVEVAGRVENRAGALFLTGRAESVLELRCDRCLKPFSQPMSVPVETLLAEELADEESDDIVLLEDGEVDLDELFTTAVVLSMDAKHLCSEDCKGLCPRCGANLNDGPCSCGRELDPRFAALAQLLDKESDD